MLATTLERCHRCLEALEAIHVVGDDYCRKCKVDIKMREESDARRANARARFSVVKDLTPTLPGAA
jgi:predicted transcriptional regulator